jgi:hypothetical protein
MKKTILLLTFIIIFSVIVIADCPDGMVSYYRFEEDFNDDFSGSEIDSDKWTQGLCDGCSINAVNNKVRFYTEGDGSNQFNTLYSKTSLKGDFDIQVDFSTVIFNRPPGTGVNRINLMLSGPNTSGGINYALIGLNKISSATYYRFQWRNDGPLGASDSISTSDGFGKFRIKRVGSTIYGYYWTGSSWSLAGTLSGGWTVDVNLIRLQLSSVSGSSDSLTADFDNFIINKGGAVYDSKGNNAGSNQGATLTTGKLGNALSFDGVDDLIRVPDSISLNLESEMSSFVWIKPLDTSTQQILFGQYDTGANKRSWGIGLLSNQYRILLSGDGTNTNLKDYRFDSTTDDWALVGFTWSNGTLKTYLNGVEITTPTKSSNHPFISLYNSDVDLTIGSVLNDNAAILSFNGSIDEVAIFNRALPATEIKELYQATANKGVDYCSVKPIATTFQGTDINTIPDLTQVQDFTITKSEGSVKWNNNLNLVGEDLDSNVNLGADFVSLNVNNLHSSLNTSAEISFVIDSCSNPTIFYVNEGFYNNFNDIKSNGIVCPPEICSDITCNDNILTFTALHFDGFGGEGDPLSGDEPIPEFTTIGIILAVMIIGIFSIFIIKKKKK